jgi:hypothetical protein
MAVRSKHSLKSNVICNRDNSWPDQPVAGRYSELSASSAAGQPAIRSIAGPPGWRERPARSAEVSLSVSAWQMRRSGSPPAALDEKLVSSYPPADYTIDPIGELVNLDFQAVAKGGCKGKPRGLTHCWPRD